MYMPRNKTQKKYNKKRLKGMGSKFSVPAKETKEKTPSSASTRKAKKNVTFKETPDVFGESPEETEKCYNCYSKNDQKPRHDALIDEAKEMGLEKNDEINSYLQTKAQNRKDSKKRNKKIVKEIKPVHLQRKERESKERMIHEYIGQLRK